MQTRVQTRHTLRLCQEKDKAIVRKRQGYCKKKRQGYCKKKDKAIARKRQGYCKKATTNKPRSKVSLKEALQLKEPPHPEVKPLLNGIKRGKGRPKGSKNKSKDLIQAIKI